MRMNHLVVAVSRRTYCCSSIVYTAEMNVASKQAGQKYSVVQLFYSRILPILLPWLPTSGQSEQTALISLYALIMLMKTYHMCLTQSLYKPDRRWETLGSNSNP